MNKKHILGLAVLGLLIFIGRMVYVLENNTMDATQDQNIQTDISACSCREGYVKEGDACTPKCYYSVPKCLMPLYLCIARP